MRPAIGLLAAIGYDQLETCWKCALIKPFVDLCIIAIQLAPWLTGFLLVLAVRATP